MIKSAHILIRTSLKKERIQEKIYKKVKNIANPSFQMKEKTQRAGSQLILTHFPLKPVPPKTAVAKSIFLSDVLVRN